MSELSVLLVDDDGEFLEVLVKRLKKRNINVTGVSSGDAALETLRKTAMDVVVLDVKMPKMNGIETLLEIKKNHPLVEVIMLTGLANIEAAIEGLEAGAFDYLMKPMEIDELVYKVQDAHKKKALLEEKIKRIKNGVKA